MGEKGNLVRGLTPVHAGALVVGTVIGTGIFLKAGIMSQTVGAAHWMLLAWVAAGILSFAGALVYAEIGSMFPKAGGEYVYIREAYGDLPGFLYGWMRFWVASPGSIAAYAVGGATFLGATNIPGVNGIRTPLAVGFILFFTLLSCLSVRFGGKNAKELERFLKFAVVGAIGMVIDLGITNILLATVLVCLLTGVLASIQVTPEAEWTLIRWLERFVGAEPARASSGPA